MRRCLIALSVGVGTAGVARGQERIWFKDSSIADEGFAPTSCGPDLDGDGLPELLIGASLGTCANPNDGFAAIYSTTAGELHRWCGDGFGAFGGPNAWVGDVDGGGIPDVALGEPYYYDPVKFGRDTGRVQIYSTETKQLLYEIVGTQMDGRFGSPIAALDDVDADGVQDLMVGAQSYGATGAGKVFIYSMKSGSLLWSHTGTAWSYFGYRVACLRDVDGDGVDDYAAAASQRNVGRVRVYSGRTGAPLLQLDGLSGFPDNFGRSIAGPGDLDGDGLADILVAGAHPNTDGHLDAYSVATGQLIWSIAGSGSEWYGEYSFAVGDINGDGFDDFLVTAGWDDHDGKNVGRVDLVSGRGRRALHRFYAGIPGLRDFGQVLTLGSDFNGDGIEDLVIGNGDGGTNQSQGGHVAIYAGNDLFLQADPLDPVVNDTVTVDLRGAEPFTFGLVALTAIDGVPLFESLLLAPFDGNGELQIQADIDASLSGHDFSILGFAINRAGRGPLMVSSPQAISVQ